MTDPHAAEDAAWARLQEVEHHRALLDDRALLSLERCGGFPVTRVSRAAERGHDVVLFLGRLVRRRDALLLGVMLMSEEAVAGALRTDQVWEVGRDGLADLVETFDEALAHLRRALPDHLLAPA